MLRNRESAGQFVDVLPDDDSGASLPEPIILFPARMGPGNWWRCCRDHARTLHVPCVPTPFVVQKSRASLQEQKFLIGVILMVPCYSIESYVSLVYQSTTVDFEILRDCYEAFAMYCFGRYLVACLGGEESTIEFLNRKGGSNLKTPLFEESEMGVVKHPFPVNYVLKPWRLGERFYHIIKSGIVQYMIIKTLSAILAVVLEAFGVYCEGEFKLKCGYPYMAVVLNFSQSWALYCLVLFYTATQDELAHLKPLAKFVTFKSIVFLTWWQGVGIALLYSLGLFKSPIAQSLQVKSSVQDFFICIEMCIAAIVHLYVFPAEPYKRLGDRVTGVSVLGDYASLDCPLDPDEVRDSERQAKLRLPIPVLDTKKATPIKESVRDIFLGGGEYIVNDLKFTVAQAVEPMEKGFTLFNEKLNKISKNIRKHEKGTKSKDDSSIGSVSPAKRIHGIDDPLLNGSISDSGARRGRRHRWKSGYTSAESGGDSSDHGHGEFQVHGCRWVIKD